MAGPKAMQTEFGVHQRLESCELDIVKRGFAYCFSFNNSDFSSENKRSKKKREVKGKDKSGRKSKEGSPLSEEDNHHENLRENSKSKKQVLSLTQSLVPLT